jgi:hypothetical protein
MAMTVRVIIVRVIGLLLRTERQASVTVRPVMMVLVQPKAMTMGERVVHAVQGTTRSAVNAAAHPSRGGVRSGA